MSAREFAELRAKLRDAAPEIQRKAAAMFAAQRATLTGKPQPFLAITRKSGPAFRIATGGVQ